MARHDLDLLSLAFGLLFTAVGVLLLGGSGLELAWLGPMVALVVAGVVLAAAWPRRNAADEEGQPELEP